MKPSHTAAADRGERLSGWWLLGLLALLAVLGHGATVGDYFLSDDFALMRWAEMPQDFLEAAGLRPNSGPGFLRPLVKLVWWTNFALAGTDPLPYHLVNLLFHLTNAWLVGWVVFQLAGRRLVAWVAAAAFVVYPIHAEAVTWLSGRVDVIAATGYLAALGFWLRFLKGGGRGRDLVGASICFALGILSKEMAMTLPIAAAVVALTVPGSVSRKRVILGLSLLGVILGAYLGARFALFGGLGGYRTAGGGSVHARPNLRLAHNLVKHAARQAAAPAVRDRHPDTFDPLRAIPLTAVGLAALLTALGGAWRRLLRHALLGGALFLIALAPLLGWAVLADNGESSRFLYLPSAFACAVLSGAFLAGRGSTARRLALGAFAVVWVGVYLIGLHDTLRPWREAATRARHLVDTAIERSLARPEAHDMVVADLPDNHQGAFVFRNGFPQAVLLMHPHRFPAHVVPRAGWDEARRTARAAADRRRLYLRWDATARRWRED